MRRILVLIVLMLLALGAGWAKAQDAENWYFATNADGALLAYTPSGEVNTMIESGVANDGVFIQRIAPDAALGFLTVNDEKHIYYLTPDSAEIIESPVPLGDDTWLIKSQSGNYLAAAISQPPSSVGLVIDVNERRVQVLEGLVYTLVGRSILFSEDGVYARYISQDAQEQWSLRERKLETGADRVIYTLPISYPSVSSDTYGEHWMYVVNNEEQDTRDFTLIRNDGTADVIRQEPRTSLMAHTLFNEFLVSFSLQCEGDCALTLESMNSGEVLSFDAAPLNGAIPSLVTQTDENGLVVITDGQFWSLNTDGTTQSLGYWEAQYLFGSLKDLVSADGRYVVAMENEHDIQSYHVWDTINNEAVMEMEHDELHFVISHFYERGFVVSEDGKYARFFRYSDGETIALPDHSGIYFAPVSDNSLLFYGRLAEGEAVGIYRYDMDSGEFVTLIAGASPFNVVS